MDDAAFDIEQLRLPPANTTPHHLSPARPLPQSQRGEKFLKGPIPLPWLAVAAPLPGRALHVALAIWFFVGLKRSQTVKLSLSGLQSLFGISRHAARRGLKALEDAQLVCVERHEGRAPMVTLLKASITNDIYLSSRQG